MEKFLKLASMCCDYEKNKRIQPCHYLLYSLKHSSKRVQEFTLTIYNFLTNFNKQMSRIFSQVSITSALNKKRKNKRKPWTSVIMELEQEILPLKKQYDIKVDESAD